MSLTEMASFLSLSLSLAVLLIVYCGLIKARLSLPEIATACRGGVVTWGGRQGTKGEGAPRVETSGVPPGSAVNPPPLPWVLASVTRRSRAENFEARRGDGAEMER